MRTGAGIVLAHLLARPPSRILRRPANLQSPCSSAGTTRRTLRSVAGEPAPRWHSAPGCGVAAGDLAKSLQLRWHRARDAVVTDAFVAVVDHLGVDPWTAVVSTPYEVRDLDSARMTRRQASTLARSCACPHTFPGHTPALSAAPA
jgi:hypothetical protein